MQHNSTDRDTHESPSRAHAASELYDQGQQLLAEIASLAAPVVEPLRKRLSAWRPSDPAALDEAAGWLACVWALRGVCGDNYGVGAVIVDDSGRLLIAGHNEMLHPHFRSDAHAEMVVLSDLENRWPNRSKRGLTLYTSLEPCPMCYLRSLNSGLGALVHVAGDAYTGIGSLAEQLPPYWIQMSATCRRQPANVGEDLRRLSLDIFQVNFEELGRRLSILSEES